MEELERREALAAYAGDIQHTILRAVAGLGGAEITVPSYSQMVEKVYRLKPEKKEGMDNAEVIAAAQRNIFQFRRKEKAE